MPVRFRDLAEFQRQVPYQLLPFRTGAVPGVPDILIASDAGEYQFLSEADYRDLVGGRMARVHPQYESLSSRQFFCDGDPYLVARMTDAKVRTRKAFAIEGQTLHIFVVTLRCDHSCHYCQVSRRSQACNAFDMSEEDARAAVGLLFKAPARHLTVEFQGGEPLLAFPRIRQIVEAIEDRNKIEQRDLTYTITTTLHHLTDENLEFFKKYDVRVSTSLDGPEELHNVNRPNAARDSHQRTLAGLARARAHLGTDRISALTTLTRASLEKPEAIVDEYVRLGFRSIFLRPLSPYGFARRAERKIGYTMAEFVAFYDQALAYILNLNRRGIELEEAYAAVLLTRIMTPFPSGYVDLRSPAAAGRNVFVYNYDGDVYASDEGRMLAEMDDLSFRLGSVRDGYARLMQSEAMTRVRARGLAETLAPCRDCVFVPFCGADPVQAHAAGMPEDKPAASHCDRHMGLFHILFRYLAAADPDVMRIFLAWATRRSPVALQRGEM